MILPETAVKNGIMNSNPNSVLKSTDKSSLSWFNFDTTFLGIQLDAGHTADDSTVSEMSQVISAISENNFTPELFNDVYTSIEKIISNAMREFNKLGTKKVTELTNIFVRNIRNSEQINNARDILDSILEEGEKIIPFSSKAIYKQFISTVVSKINSDYIKRKFNGGAMVLNPSHSIVTVYESKDGKTFLLEDIMRKIAAHDEFTGDPILREKFKPYKADYEKFSHIGSKTAFMEYIDNAVIPSNGPITEEGFKFYKENTIGNRLSQTSEDYIYQTNNNPTLNEHQKYSIITNYILSRDESFKSDIIPVSAIKPMDTVKFNKVVEFNGIKKEIGELFSFNDIDDYYEFLEKYENDPELEVERVYHIARDLKPVEITFDYTDQNGNKISSNAFAFEAVRFKRWFEKNYKVFSKLSPNDFGINGTLNKNEQKLKHFINYLLYVDVNGKPLNPLIYNLHEKVVNDPSARNINEFYSAVGNYVQS